MRFILFSGTLLCGLIMGCSDPKNLDRDRVKDLILAENRGLDTIRYTVLTNNYFTAKRLKRYSLAQQGYWTVNDSPSKADGNVLFLPKSNPYLIGKPISEREGDFFRGYSTSKSQVVATMILELDEVTGIRMNPSKDKGIADITMKVKETTPFVVLDSVKHERYRKEGLRTQIPFTLYDDGWRFEKKPDLKFNF